MYDATDELSDRLDLLTPYLSYDSCVLIDESGILDDEFNSSYIEKAEKLSNEINTNDAVKKQMELANSHIEDFCDAIINAISYDIRMNYIPNDFSVSSYVK